MFESLLECSDEEFLAECNILESASRNENKTEKTDKRSTDSVMDKCSTSSKVVGIDNESRSSNTNNNFINDEWFDDDWDDLDTVDVQEPDAKRKRL